MAPSYDIKPRDGYVLVTQVGALCEDTATAFQRDVMAACESAGTTRVVFDNRETEAPDPAVRAKLHAWVTTPGRFECAALVLNSGLLALGVNMDALGKGIKLKGFESVEDAVAWVNR